MKCSKAKKLISLRIDGELSGALAGELDGHLAECGSCRSEYNFFMGLGEKIPAGELEPSPYFYYGFREKVKDYEARRKAVFGRLVLSPVYAAAALLLIIGFSASSFLYAYKANVNNSAADSKIIAAYVKECVFSAGLMPMACARFFDRCGECISACRKSCDECPEMSGCSKCIGGEDAGRKSN